ncbi:hypothetical protein BH11PSE7_BH11PSE7_13830 [soil metagenome]
MSNPKLIAVVPSVQAERQPVDPLLACLMQAARLHGKPSSRDNLAGGLPVAPEGLSPELALRAARRVGMEAALLQCPVALLHELKLPAILLLHDRGACLLREVSEPQETFIVSLPAGDAPVEMAADELQSLYTGHAISVQAASTEEVGDGAGSGTPNARHWFRSILMRNRGLYTDVLFAALLINLFAMAMPLFTMNVYRQQFDIGQRSLLDLLDTENEHFQAQRAYVDGKFNRYLAQARVFAGEGQLLEALSVARTDQPDLQDLQRNDGKPGVALTPCPTDIPAQYVAVVEPAPEPKAMPMVVAPAAVVTPAPVPRLAQAGEPKKDIADMIDLWLKAWMAKDMQRYLSFYAPAFDAERSNYSASYNSKNMARASWLAYRKRLVTKPGDVSVSASNVRVEMKSENLAELHFNQDYRSNDYNDKVEKVLQVVKKDGRWLINRESSIKR